MNSQKSLKRLKNIRDKYNCMDQYTTFKINDSNDRDMPTLNDLHIKRCDSIQKDSIMYGLNFNNNEYQREDQVFSRKISYSLGKNRNYNHDADYGRSNERSNRCEFSSFIKDLDEKIMQKQRNLKNKLKYNNDSYQPVRHHRQIQNQQQFYTSTAKIRKHPSQKSFYNTQYSIKRNNPIPIEKQIYQSNKSSYQQYFTQPFFTHSNNQPLNNFPLNKYNDSSQKIKADIKSRYIIQQKLKTNDRYQKPLRFYENSTNKIDSFRDKYHAKQNQYTSLVHSKQTYKAISGKNQQDRNNWNPKKIQNIQDRIKNVLKKTNH